jgi:hypothetical protein
MAIKSMAEYTDVTEMRNIYEIFSVESEGMIWR